MNNIPFSVLESIDRAMCADRDRMTPEAWQQALRTEAVATMVARYDADPAAATRDLDDFLAASADDVTTTLETLVYEQRFLAAAATEEAHGE